MKKIKVFLFLFALTGIAKAQLIATDSFITDARKMAADNLGNIYLIKADNSIEKRNCKGQLLNQNNFKVYGNLYSIDVSNPFEIYLYYKESNKIVFTDNQLTYRGLIDLNNTPELQAVAVARSFDNGIWVFDLSDMQLKKYDKNMQLQQQSGNILQFVSGNVEINKISDQFNRVIIYNEETGFEWFDIFANHIKSLSFTQVNTWFNAENAIYYSNVSGLYQYNIKTLDLKQLTLDPDEPVISVSLLPGGMAVLFTNKAACYSIPQD